MLPKVYLSLQSRALDTVLGRLREDADAGAQTIDNFLLEHKKECFHLHGLQQTGELSFDLATDGTLLQTHEEWSECSTSPQKCHYSSGWDR